MDEINLEDPVVSARKKAKKHLLHGQIHLLDYLAHYLANTDSTTVNAPFHEVALIKEIASLAKQIHDTASEELLDFFVNEVE